MDASRGVSACRITDDKSKIQVIAELARLGEEIMRRSFVAFVLACAMPLGGCGAIRDDLRHPGGYPGKLLDRRTFDASRSKHIQLWRATLMVAVAARIGESAVDPEDADAFARQLAEAAREINFAAADAGFPVTQGPGRVLPTCKIERGMNDASDPLWDIAETPSDDVNCAGYFVNFESHMAKIEGRVIRAMLTSLPTDKARQFLNDVGKGDVLSAMWSLTKTFGDIAGAFHRGAGVYRTGTESMAASMKSCKLDQSYNGLSLSSGLYDEHQDTVLKAAACLGLSRKDLFDAETVGASDLPVRLRPAAFHALFRVARAACVNLPTITTTDDDYLSQSRIMRSQACGALTFVPRTQPLDIPVPAEAAAGAKSGDLVNPVPPGPK